MSVEPKAMSHKPGERECWFAWGPELSWLAQVWEAPGHGRLLMWRGDGHGGWEPEPFLDEHVQLSSSLENVSFAEVHAWQRRILTVASGRPQSELKPEVVEWLNSLSADDRRRLESDGKT